MTTLIVSRHAGALAWMKNVGVRGRHLAHLDAAALKGLRPGDVVVGTLPVPLAAAVIAAGARYVHLTLPLAEAERGSELSAADLHRLGASLAEYRVEGVAGDRTWI